MGGKSSKTVVGYKYYVGFQMILAKCIHRILSISVDGNVAWTGTQTNSGVININAPDLFGGDKGSDPEGGVVGAVAFQQGLDTQEPNAYLQSKLGADIPASRGVSGLVAQQIYSGNSPYLKQWSVTGERIHIGDDGNAQWYDEKAAVSSASAPAPYSVAFPNRNSNYFVVGACEEVGGTSVGNQGWWNGYIDSFRITKGVARYPTLQYSVPSEAFGDGSTDANYSNVILLLRMQGAEGGTIFTDDKGHAVTAHSAITTTAKSLHGSSVGKFNGFSSWLECTMGSDKDFGTSPWTMDAWVWMESTTGPNELGCGLFGFGELSIVGYDTAWYSKNTAWAYRQSFAPTLDQLNEVNQSMVPNPETGRWMFVSVCWDGKNLWMHQDGQLLTAGEASDMNPAHMIRECLANNEWGYGYDVEDIDDDNFRAAADTFRSEAFGLSYFWDDPETDLDDVLEKLENTVDCAVYVDRSTLKWTIKPIRNDYDPAALPVFTMGAEILEVDSFNRPAFMDLYNTEQITYSSNIGSTNPTITVPNAALLLQQGVTKLQQTTYEMICNSFLASRVAERDLLADSSPLENGTVFLDYTSETKKLHRGAVCKLTMPLHNMFETIVRVTDIGFGDGTTKKIKMSFLADKFSLNSTTAIPIIPPTPGSGGVTALPVLFQQAMEVPYYFLVQEQGQQTVDQQVADNPELGIFGIAAARPSGGLSADLYLDTGSGYAKAGQCNFCPYGVLAADLPLPGIAGSNTFTLSNYEDLDELVENHILLIGNEFVCGVHAGNGVFNTVARACLDSIPAQHLAGAAVLGVMDYLDSDEKDYADGETVNLKLLTNSTGGVLALGDATAASVAFASRASKPYPPANVKIAGAYFPATAAGTFSVTWASRNRKQQTGGGVPLGFLDGSVTAAPNTRYSLLFKDSAGTLLAQKDNIGTPTASVALGVTDTITMECWTVDDNGASMFKFSTSFGYTPTVGVTTNTITADTYTPVDDSTIIDGGDIDG